ncbi:MAG TPA: hypothetical protein VJN18_06510 [Polyangiaceae bacterium]|nr:hypothetical protein [Polyangiaceae bacterium]
MALSVGNEQANSGMSKAIYDKLNELLSPKIPTDKLPDVQEGWQQLAFAVATGVVAHLLENLEIKQLEVSGSVSLPVASGAAAGTITLPQSSATTGHVA